MLYKAMKKELEIQFPQLKFTSNDIEKLITISPMHKDVGNIEIQDDIDELSIFVGNFTHWHAGYYDKESGSEEQINNTVSEVIEFLRDMFNDKIFMWGNAMNGGGFEYIDEGFSTKESGLVWSGPYQH